MRGLIDRALRRLGYMPITKAIGITGEVVYQLGERPWVDLKLPGGNRVVGHVDNGLPFDAIAHPEDRLPLTLGEWSTDEDGRTLSGASVCGTCDGGGCRDCIG